MSVLRPVPAALAAVLLLTALPVALGAEPAASYLTSLSGRLTREGTPVSGLHEFRFRLLAAAEGPLELPKTRPVVLSVPVADGAWQAALDLRRLGGERSILDEALFPAGSAADILDEEGLPSLGDRSPVVAEVFKAFQWNWRNVEVGWLEIAVRRPGEADFVALTPRQRLGVVPRAGSALLAEHAAVAATVTESGVDTRALADGSVTPQKLAPDAVGGAALADRAITGPKIAEGSVVRSLNGATDDVSLAAGAGVTIVRSGATLTISAAGGGGGTPPLPNGNFLAGGARNEIEATVQFSTIGGGDWNRITADAAYSGILSGENNSIAEGATRTVIAGGQANFVTNSAHATIGGGIRNQVGGDRGTVGGGSDNVARADATVGGGANNRADGLGAVVGGGTANLALEMGTTVAGGASNQASQPWATVAGGVNHRAAALGAFIGGGDGNRVEASLNGSIPGGAANVVTNSVYGAILGGESNRTADSRDAVVAGGAENVVEQSQFGVILGGANNRVGPDLTGQGFGTVVGGRFNEAGAAFTLAAGFRAQATNAGTFVWNGWSAEQAAFGSEAEGEFAARAPGGFRLLTAGTEPGRGDIRLDAGAATLRAVAKTAEFQVSSTFAVTAPGGISLDTGGRGLLVDGQPLSSGAGHGNRPLRAITGGGQTEPQLTLEQTNPDDFVRMFVNTPRTYWTVGAGGAQGSFSFYVPAQSPANSTGEGAVRFLITPNGEVGVGPDRPLAQFHVRGRGGFDLPQLRATQLNPAEYARLRLEAGPQAWDLAAGPDGSLRFFGGGADRLVLTPGPRLELKAEGGINFVTGGQGLTVDGQPLATGAGAGGGPVAVNVPQGVAVRGVTDMQAGDVGVSGTGRVGVQALSSAPDGAAVQAVQLHSSGYAGDFAGKVKVSGVLEANGGARIGGPLRVTGAGINTPTTAFRLEVAALALSVACEPPPGTRCTSLAVLDHPLLNGRPDALLLLTPVDAAAFELYRRGSDRMVGDFLAYHPDDASSPAALRGRWTMDVTPPAPPPGLPEPTPAGRFNALIVTP